MKIAVVNYNAGNVQSVLFALERLGANPILTDNIQEIQTADKVIFPGQGEASSTMKHLKARNLDVLLPTLKQDFLGICIGMQLMCEYSEEGNTKCLGIVPQKVVKFEPKRKVPHIGWNTIDEVKGELMTTDLAQQYVYFVHSYYVELGTYTAATTNYIVPFSASLQKDNFYATQFHPEKSGSVGEKILKNFLAI